MCWGIALPSDQVLFLAPILPISEDLLDFPFLFAIDKVWWWLKEVRAMFLRFFVGRQQGRMEYIVDFPFFWDFQTIRDIGYLCSDVEWPISPRCQLHSFIWKF
jgi:hypothetical protein